MMSLALQGFLQTLCIGFVASSVFEDHQSCISEDCGGRSPSESEEAGRSLLQLHSRHDSSERSGRGDRNSLGDDGNRVTPVPSPGKLPVSLTFSDDDDLYGSRVTPVPSPGKLPISVMLSSDDELDEDEVASRAQPSPTPASPSPWVPDPANPRTFQVKGTDQPLDAIGYAAKIAECCMTGMDAWLRKYIDEKVNLEICNEGGFSGMLATVNCQNEMDFTAFNEYLTKEAAWDCPWLRPKGNCPDPPEWPAHCPRPDEEGHECAKAWHRRRACVRRRTPRVVNCCAPDTPAAGTFLQHDLETEEDEDDEEEEDLETLSLSHLVARNTTSAEPLTTTPETTPVAAPMTTLATTPETTPEITTTITTTTITTTTITTTTITTTTYPTSPTMPSFVQRFKCNGDVQWGPVQLVGGPDGVAAAQLEVDTGKYGYLWFKAYNSTEPPFEFMNSCGINPDDDLAYCTVLLGGNNYLVRLDAVRMEFVAKLPRIWNGRALKFNTGAFSRGGTFYCATFTAIIFKIPNSSKLVGVADWWAPTLTDLTSSPGFQVPTAGGFGDMVVINDDLTGSGVEEEFAMALNSWFLVVMKLSTAKIEYWYVPVTGLRGLITNFGAGWYFAGHVFFASNHGLGVYEIPLEELFLYDCKNHYCPQIKLQMIGQSDAAALNDGFNCLGGSNPWATTIRPFDCTRVSGIMKTFKSFAGYDIMSLDIKTAKKNVLFNIPFNRTTPPFTSLTSVSLNPKDDIFYGVMTVGALPYLVRLDEARIEFVGKLPADSNGITGGSFNELGHYMYTTKSSPPLRFVYKDVHNMKGRTVTTDPELSDYSRKKGLEMAVVAADGTTKDAPAGMSSLVIVRSNFEGPGDEADYVIGIDDKNRLVVTKDNCSHQETWCVDTGSAVTGGFGAAYSFGGHIYFEAKDGSGIYEVPLEGFDLHSASPISLKLAGVNQVAGGTDFAGWSEDGFNCMKSPSPFYSGDCQMGWHKISGTTPTGTCPAGSIPL